MRHYIEDSMELPIEQTLLNLSFSSQATYTEETDWLLGRQLDIVGPSQSSVLARICFSSNTYTKTSQKHHKPTSRYPAHHLFRAGPDRYRFDHSDP